MKQAIIIGYRRSDQKPKALGDPGSQPELTKVIREMKNDPEKAVHYSALELWTNRTVVKNYKLAAPAAPAPAPEKPAPKKSAKKAAKKSAVTTDDEL